MEIFVHQFEHLLLIAFNLAAQSPVAIRTQTLDNTVDHRRTEDIILLKDSTLTLNAIGRSLAAVGKLGKCLQFVFILFLVDIHIYISLFGKFQCILNLKAVTASNRKTGYQLINIGRTIGRTHLHRLLLYRNCSQPQADWQSCTYRSWQPSRGEL